MKKHSWQTTSAGLGAIFAALVTLILNPLLDGDPETLANWNMFIPILIGGIGGLFARDSSVSDEEAGAGRK